MKYLNQGIWAIGGYGDSGARRTMEYFNMTSNTWTIRSLPIYGVIIGHCLAQISEYKLILLGGNQGAVSEL